MSDTPPPPSNREPWYPFIIDQQPDGRDGVLVTWSLPGLKRATVRVPADAWVNGEHLNLVPALVTMAQIADVVAGDVDERDSEVTDNDDAEYVGDY
jgi:hypothetical protein